jgi:hypothetical protein
VSRKDSVFLLTLLVPLWVLVSHYRDLPPSLPILIQPLTGDVLRTATRAPVTLLKSPSLAVIVIAIAGVLERGCADVARLRGLGERVLGANALLFTLIQLAVVLKESLYAAAFLTFDGSRLSAAGVGYVRAANLASLLQVLAFVGVLSLPAILRTPSLLYQAGATSPAPGVYTLHAKWVFNFGGKRGRAVAALLAAFLTVALAVR